MKDTGEPPVLRRLVQRVLNVFVNFEQFKECDEEFHNCLFMKMIKGVNKKMKIVFLDAKSIGDDIDLSGFDQLGEVVKYGFSTPEEAGERTKDADVVIINKVQINEQTIGRADHLKLVCVTATGTNNLDKEYLAKRQIEWRNVAGYSTETVAQHTFALLFYLLEKLNYYDQYVKSEKYIGDTIFTHFSNVFHDLNGMTWGIVGLGNIGRRVADIAKMFGCHVIYYSTSGKNYIRACAVRCQHTGSDERRSLCKNEEICDFLKSRTRTDCGGAGSGRCIEKQ